MFRTAVVATVVTVVTSSAATAPAQSAPVALTLSVAASTDGAATARAGGGRIVVRGVLTDKAGERIRRARVDTFPLTRSHRPGRLASTTSTATGHYRLVIRRTPFLARYAEQHNGRINLVLWVFMGTRVWVRGEKFRYRSPSKSLPDEVTLGRTPMLASRPLTRGKQPATMYDGELVDSHWATIARISASRGFTTRLNYFRNLETVVSFGIQYGTTISISGWLALAEGTATSLEATLRGSDVRRRIQVEIEHRRYTVCDYRTWLNGGRQCIDYVIPHWSGGFRDIRAKYRGCSGLPSEYQRWRAVGPARWRVAKVSGKGFTSSWTMGGFGADAATTTQFSQTNYQQFAMRNARHTSVDRFCLGGVDGTWVDASEVVTQSVYDYPCNPPSRCVSREAGH